MDHHPKEITYSDAVGESDPCVNATIHDLLAEM
jgi:hypothetical protein